MQSQQFCNQVIKLAWKSSSHSWWCLCFFFLHSWFDAQTLAPLEVDVKSQMAFLLVSGMHDAYWEHHSTQRGEKMAHDFLGSKFNSSVSRQNAFIWIELKTCPKMSLVIHWWWPFILLWSCYKWAIVRMHLRIDDDDVLSSCLDEEVDVG
jgi:hypothetical protein